MAMSKKNRTVYLKDVLENFYIKDNILMRKVSKNCYVLKDTPAGYLDSADGLLKTKLNGICQHVHRLMYQIYNNVDVVTKDMIINHIDGNKSNNIKENLQLVDSFEKNHNLRKYNKGLSGYTGVCWHKRLNVWQSYISLDGKRRHLGNYDDPIEAAEAYDIAAIRKNAVNHILNFPEKREKYDKFIEENGTEFTVFKLKSENQSGHKFIICDKKSETKKYWRCTLSNYNKSFPFTEEGLKEAIQWRNDSYFSVHGKSFIEPSEKKRVNKNKKIKTPKEPKKLTLKDLFDKFYIKDSILMRRKAVNNYIGKDIPAGRIDKSDGYYKVSVNGKQYSNHRLIYQMYHNLEELPEDLVIDHIDRNRTNNSIENLHLVDSYGNAHNLSKDPRNTSGYTGVCWHTKICRWQSYITSAYDKIHLGYHIDIVDAAEAYDIAALRRDDENHVLNFPEKREQYLKYINEKGKEIIKNSKIKSKIQSGEKFIYFDGGLNRKSYWKVSINKNYQKYVKSFPYSSDGLQLAIQWRNATYERLFNKSFNE